MFNTGFPPEWSTLKKLIWLVGSGIAGAAKGIWKTVTGTLIHITDALASPMQKCEVTLEPIQDLHGQDAPYPAGGGVNKFNGEFNTFIPCDFASGTVLTLQGEMANDVYIVLRTYDENQTFLQSGSTIYGDGTRFATMTLTSDAKYFRVEKGSSVEATNVMLSIGDGVQPYAPNSNLCPITGWTGCEATRAGKNLFDKEKPITFGYLISSTGAITENVSYGYSEYYTPVLPSTAYIFSGQIVSLGTYNSVSFYDSSKKFISRIVPPSSGVGASFTTPSNCYFIRFNTGNALNININTIQLEQGSTATDYEAPNITTLSVTFPDSAGTVYGGTVDLVSGNGESKMASVDLGTLNFSLYNATANRDAYRATINIARPANNVPINALSSIYKAVAYNASWVPGTMSTSHEDNEMVFCTKPGEYADATAFKAAMSGVQLVYELAEPIEIQLTPQEISTLAGENNVWSNGDSVEITYKAQAE